MSVPPPRARTGTLAEARTVTERRGADDADLETAERLGLLAVVAGPDDGPLAAGWLVPLEPGGLALRAAVPDSLPPEAGGALFGFLRARTGDARVAGPLPDVAEGADRESRFPRHEHGGVRALVMLHETAFRDFLDAWREFVAAGAALPETDDPDYASPAHLLHHVCRAARGYLRWCAETLSLPDPAVTEPPDLLARPEAAAGWAEHLLLRWRTVLVAAKGEECDRLERPSAWGVVYCPDAMLEHAVMHPTRHAFQLRRLRAAAPA